MFHYANNLLSDEIFAHEFPKLKSDRHNKPGSKLLSHFDDLLEPKFFTESIF